MTFLHRLEDLARKFEAEDTLPKALPIPWHARNHEGGYYCCRSCGKLFVDVASIRRHQSQYCTASRESERSVSLQRLMDS